MDELGVLTERFGLKPQGKSAPMAASKLSNDINRTQSNSTFDSKSFSYVPKSANNLNSLDGYFHDDDIFFGSKNPQSLGSENDAFDIFGGFPKNLMQTIKNGNGATKFDGDILGGLSGLNSSSTDDIFWSFDPNSKQAAPIDDLFGNFVAKPTAPSQNGSVGFDYLIPGFGPFNSSKKEDNASVNQSTFTIDEKVKNSNESLVDELEEFARGKGSHSNGLRSDVHPGSEVKQTAKDNKYEEAEDAAWNNRQNSAPDLVSLFSTPRSSSVPEARVTTSDPIFDVKIIDRRDPSVPEKNSSVSSPGIKKASSTVHMYDDLFSMFGDTSSIGEFEEFEGESEGRRKARLERILRINDRVAQAVADMNQRDLKTQREQEERRRIAETLDAHIKQWAAGKEGNMRALLSSLQYVLWSESGWEPVSLTDLITSSSVKKVYRKATLCVHPDKVQQKGSTLEQKYTAEKVFDILKEAWTKFNRDELS